jgi:hypothetical protein
VDYEHGWLRENRSRVGQGEVAVEKGASRVEAVVAATSPQGGSVAVGQAGSFAALASLQAPDAADGMDANISPRQRRIRQLADAYHASLGAQADAAALDHELRAVLAAELAAEMLPDLIEMTFDRVVETAARNWWRVIGARPGEACAHCGSREGLVCLIKSFFEGIGDELHQHHVSDWFLHGGWRRKGSKP